MRLLAIAIVVEALRLFAPGERAHAEGEGPLRCDRYFLICQGKLECFKHSSYYLPTKDRIWQAAADVRLIAVTCYIRPSIRSFRIMSARVNGTEKLNGASGTSDMDGKAAKVAESKAGS